MPRAYEVAGQLIKNVADATDKLMDLQKKLKDVEEEKQSRGPSNVTNALFVGSTAELAKLLKEKDKMSGDLGQFFSLIGKAKRRKMSSDLWWEKLTSIRCFLKSRINKRR